MKRKYNITLTDSGLLKEIQDYILFLEKTLLYHRDKMLEEKARNAILFELL